MLALIIVAGILLFFLLLSLLRVGFEADYSANGLEVRLKVACFHIRLYPGRPSKQKHAKQSKDSAPPEDTDRPSQEQKKKLGDLKQLLEFSGPILEALGRLRRKLRIELLRLEYCIGGAEATRQTPPSNTASSQPAGVYSFRCSIRLLMSANGMCSWMWILTTPHPGSQLPRRGAGGLARWSVLCCHWGFPP